MAATSSGMDLLVDTARLGEHLGANLAVVDIRFISPTLPDRRPRTRA